MKEDDYEDEDLQMIEFSISGELITKKAPLIDEDTPVGFASMSCKVKGSLHSIISTIANIMDSDETVREVIMSAAAAYALKDIGNKYLLGDIEELQDNDIENKLKLSKLMRAFSSKNDLDIN